MKILGIDTATDICGIALTENKRLITEYRSNLKRVHAEKLIDSIDKVLNDVELTINDLDCIAISIGPGSFTGLRIGLSTVKGLTFNTNIKVVAVNTLDALAYGAIFANRYICPIIKAQANQCYTALYDASDFVLKKISEYTIITIERMEEFVADQTLIINIGMKEINSYIDGSKNIIIAPEELSLLSGLSVAQLGYEKFMKNDVDDIDSLEPYYLKNFIAKKGKKLF